MRLNRYISLCGIASRRKSETFITERRVTINDVIVDSLAIQIDMEKDIVRLDGKEIKPASKNRYYLMNKPVGVIVSRGDTHGRKTVFDFLEADTLGVFPVGRLDFNTSGVLILTDDGEMAFRLTHPSFGVEKVYRAEIRGLISNDDIAAIKTGVVLEDGKTSPAKIIVFDRNDYASVVEITLHEGKKRQVRRMFDALGHRVKKLERISFGNIKKESLQPGEYRALTGKEIVSLKKIVRLGDKISDSVKK